MQSTVIVTCALAVAALIGRLAVGDGDAKRAPDASIEVSTMQHATGRPWKPRGVFVSDERLATLKLRIAHRVEPTWSAWLRLKNQADDALNATPHAMRRWHVPGYYRDADGHRAAKNGLRDDANRSYTLALAFRMTDDPRYARAAVRLIDAWPATIEQMSTKADSTLSFSYHFPAIIFAADLLEPFDGWPIERRRAFRAFVRDRALPMNTMQGTNNWGNWGLVLASSCASYLGDRDLFKACAARWKELLATQVAPDGHLPHEVNRNEGRHGIWYSHFCLMPQTLAAEILRLGGVDLYDYRTPDTNRTMKLAFDRLAPWVSRPETFPYWTGDPDDLVGVGYYAYFELLNARWPNTDATGLLAKSRPMNAQHSTPHLTFTHGELRDDAPDN